MIILQHQKMYCMNVFNQIKELIRGRRTYFFTFSILVFISVIFILIFGREFCSIPLAVNHPAWLNIILINYTFMGNGLFAVSVAFIFMFRFNKKQEGFSLLLGFLISTIIVQLVKNAGNLTGATLYLEMGQYLFQREKSIAGPFLISGHTATAFTLVTVLVLYLKRNSFQLPLLAMAVILGFSRMYLAQHLLGDILSAALVGTVSGVVAFLFIRMRSFDLAAYGIKFRAGYKAVSPSGENSLPLIQ